MVLVLFLFARNSITSTGLGSYAASGSSSTIRAMAQIATDISVGIFVPMPQRAEITGLILNHAVLLIALVLALLVGFRACECAAL